MALDTTNHPQDGAHAAGESPTSLDTVCALKRHEEGEQFTLPGIRATVALAETLQAPEVEENVFNFNQKQRYHLENWLDRVQVGRQIAGYAQGSTHPFVRSYGESMRSCSENVAIFETPRGARLLRRMGRRCNKSHCPDCRRINNQVFIRNALPVAQTQLENGGRLRTIVLTWKSCENTPEALKAAAEGIFKAWTKLRRQAWIKGALWGTIATFEHTLNADTGLLHPHLNVLVCGPEGSEGYISQRELSEAWNALSDCPIVWIQEALQFGNDAMKAFNEVVKYISKGIDIESAQDAETLILGTRNVRLRRCTGVFRKIKDEASEEEMAEEEMAEQVNAADPASPVTPDEAKAAVLLAIVPMSEAETLLAILDSQVKLAPAFYYARTGSLPLTAMAGSPPISH